MRLIVEDVRVRFGDRVVLDELSAEFRSGEVHAIVGPSGSGKTTLLGVLAGTQRIDGGHVHLEDGNGKVRRLDPEQIVWVPQGANALSGRSVLDNTMIGALASGAGLAAARDRSHAALVDVGLDDLAAVTAKTLSGGELQRLSLARAIASGREVVLVDEPTASLDAANTQRVAKILAALSISAMLIVATHDEVVVEAAQSVLRLRGR